ncbi:PEGA domain-containing protein [candidate division CSSED10-310 bacterium]|uniref:PEGA domain-containing protein n=1 Tax=candidate division CSSED10-310 bacterium TaxID=2855610 RepID=A0ABV6Z3F5_UNCC1
MTVIENNKVIGTLNDNISVSTPKEDILMQWMPYFARQFAGLNPERPVRQSIPALPTEQTGQVIVSVNVDGVIPIIDGSMGSPVFSREIKLNLAPGKHSISFSKSGHSPSPELNITVEEGGTQRYEARLTRLSGGEQPADLSLGIGIVELKTMPDNARIMDGTVETGTTPYTAKLSVGRHGLRFVKPGYHELACELVVSDGINHFPVKELKPAFGDLLVNSIPSGPALSLMAFPALE